MNWLGVEIFIFPSWTIVQFLFGIGCVSLIYNACYILGMTCSSQIKFACGLMLALPITLSVDLILRGNSVPVLSLMGVSLIILAQGVLMDWKSPFGNSFH